MKGLITDPAQKELANRIKFEDDEKFWLPVKLGDNLDAGKILVSLRILKKDEAEKMPQGKGQSHPNDDPFLPAPEGRLKLTVNPFEMIYQLVGGMVLRRLLMILAMIVCGYLCFMMTPMILSNLITK